MDSAWHCPTCGRAKHRIVRKSQNGDLTFLLSDRTFYAPGERHDSKRAVVSGDRGLLASQLGREACQVAGVETASSYAQFLSAPEVALVVLAEAYGRHNVKNDEADDLVARLVEGVTMLELGSSDDGY